MTISLTDNNPRISYTVNAGATQTSFTVPFEFFDIADLNVYVDGTQKSATTHYTVSSGGSGSTGTIALTVTGASGGSTVVITRDIDLARTTDFPTSGSFNIAALNTELDKITAQFADRKDDVDRSLRLQDSDAAASMELPLKDARKGTVLGFNATTGVPEAGPTIADVSTLSAITADIAALADIEDGTTATDAISGLAAIKANVTTVAGVASNVTTVAGQTTNMANITNNLSAVQNAATNATTATTKASEAATSATNAASSATSAASSASTATTKASEASTSATNSASSASTASGHKDTATTKASEAASSATAAAASASTASTQASNAATSASTSSTQATNSASSATASANSATAAASSATAAASSATAAAASQTAAAASASSAASSFDSFDDRYLGPKSSDPSQDNDGNSLVSGALYFNSTSNEMRVYDGANWIAATSAGNVSLILYEYTATAGQTTFSGSDDNSATLSYTVDNLQVVMNGVILDPSDFTATNGTSVVLASGAALNDLVNIYAFKSFTTADMVSKTNGGTFAGAVTFDGGANFGDNDKAQFGAGNDLQIYHDSSNSYVKDAGTGDLLVQGTQIKLQDASGNDYLRGFTGGSVYLHHAGNSKFETTSSGAAIAGKLDVGSVGASGGTAGEVAFGGVGGSIDGFRIRNTEGNYLELSAVSSGNKMVLTNTGNVGIGTASPTVDGSLAGVTVPSGSRYLHVHDGDSAVLKVSDPATSANRGAQFGIINTTAILNNCESGNLLIGQGNAEVARFHQGGVVGIGTTTANYTTTQGFVVVPASNGYIANGHASGTANGTSYQLFSLAGTAIGSVSQASSSSVAYNTTSDYRRKTAVSYDWDATTRLKQLKPCRFKWISEGDTAPFVDGFLAHEVSDTVPEAITGEKDAMKDEEYVVTEAKGDIYTPATDDADEVIHSSDVERPMSLADGRAWRETAPQVTATRNVPDYQQIDQSKLVPLLVKTIQELEARIAALETA